MFPVSFFFLCFHTFYWTKVRDSRRDAGKTIFAIKHHGHENLPFPELLNNKIHSNSLYNISPVYRLLTPRIRRGPSASPAVLGGSFCYAFLCVCPQCTFSSPELVLFNGERAHQGSILGIRSTWQRYRLCVATELGGFFIADIIIFARKHDSSNRHGVHTKPQNPNKCCLPPEIGGVPKHKSSISCSPHCFLCTEENFEVGGDNTEIIFFLNLLQERTQPDGIPVCFWPKLKEVLDRYLMRC